MSDVPFSRPWSARHVAQGGTTVVVTAEPAEREALARDLGLVSLDRLVGRFDLQGRPDSVHVTGVVEADVVQTCVVSLDPFPARVAEEVDLRFRERSEREARLSEGAEPGGEVPVDLDAPDELVDGTIDLGAVTVEFLALGLDPYPRKPGVSLDDEMAQTGAPSPFAALAALKDDGS